jgi:hypothetical protein
MKRMMKNKKMFVGFLTVAVIIGTALSALALSSYLSTFNNQYGTASTKLDTCLLCHGQNGPPNNPFGAAFAANNHDFAAIEQLDSDGDGYSNLEEITAGTFPGDPNDFPNAPPVEVACIPTEGTIGTEVVCTGSGFGSQKGKVVLGATFAKIAKGGWTNTTISSAMTKVLLAGPYDMTIYPKSASPILMPNAFTVMDPVMDALLIDNGILGTPITITGKYFSTKKGKVYLEDPVSGKIKKCKVTEWSMDPTNGVSTLTFVVPKLPKGLLPGPYTLKVINKVGTAQTPFTVNP